MKLTLGLTLLGLLGALGGCSSQTQGERERHCSNPLFGPETPEYICRTPGALRDELQYQAYEVPPKDLWDIGETPIEVDTDSRGVGPTLGFIRLPGFPEHRFLVLRTYTLLHNIGATCYSTPIEGCWDRIAREKGFQYVAYPAIFIPGMQSVLSNYYPVLVGKGGSTEATLEWVTQYMVPRDIRPLRDPYEYRKRLEEGPDTHTFRHYTYRRTYRAVLEAGRNARVELGPFQAELAPQYDGRPMGKGYLAYGIDMAELWRIQSDWSVTPEDKERLYAMQFYFANDPYYAFQEASGIIAPPMPLCQPGMGYRVRSLMGGAMFRNKVFPFDRYPLEDYEGRLTLPGTVMPYLTHRVMLVDREVINYDRSGGIGSSGVGHTVFYPLEFHPEGYPGHPRGRPQDLARYPLWGEDPPGRTLRLAILYRQTLFSPDPGDWRPHPSHPLGEDNWHIVWSDVRLAGTKERPDCAVERIGYHMYDWNRSRELDAYFDLDERPTPREVYTFHPSIPVLTRLNPVDSLGRLAVPVGSVTLPDWALPPGW